MNIRVLTPIQCLVGKMWILITQNSHTDIIGCVYGYVCIIQRWLYLGIGFQRAENRTHILFNTCTHC
jgi:hypothetical protein